MPVILALDTSTPQLTVALSSDGQLRGVAIAAGRRTGASLAPAVASILEESGLGPAELDGVAVGVGPGPYTSLRVGIMYATTVGFALGLPVVGMCTHDFIATAVVRAGLPTGVDTFLVATDARRREVYLARYDAAGRRISGPLVLSPAVAGQRWPADPWFAPPGLLDAVAGVASYPAQPDARQLAHLVATRWPLGTTELGQVPRRWGDSTADGESGPGVPVGFLRPEPLYLRRPDAAEPGTR